MKIQTPKIFTIIAKDLKLLLRSRSSALIVILGPLLIVLLVGLGYSTASLSGLNLGIYSDSYSDLTNSLVGQLNKHFVVVKADTKDSCINGVKMLAYHVCAVFPANLDINTKENIVFYVDYSRINLVYNIIDTVSSELKKKSSELSLELVKALTEKLNEANVELTNKKAVVNTIVTSSGEAESKATSISNNLNTLDLEFSSSNTTFTDIRNEVSTIETQNNISLSTLSGYINDLESYVAIIGNKLSTAKTTRDSIINDITTIQNTLQQTTSSTTDIGNSINKIIISIESLKTREAETIVSPIRINIEAVTAEKTKLNYIFPTFLVLIVMFIGIILSSTLIVREKTSTANFRNFITPTSDATFIAGHYLTSLFLVMIEILIISFISLIFLKFEFFKVLFNVFIVLILISTVFILIGMVIGYVFRSNETSNLASISIASVLLLFSNAILPLETLPSSLKSVVSLNPFVVSEAILRRVILFGNSLAKEIYSILFVLICIIVLAGLVYLARKLTKRRLS